MGIVRKEMEMEMDQEEMLRVVYMNLMKRKSGMVKIKEKQVDLVVVPLGMGLLLAYHIWLIYTIRRHPRRTVIGLNAETRRNWAFCLMADPLKNGVLAIQTLRNNIMASTLLATIAITLSSLISVYVSNESTSSGGLMQPSIKFFCTLVCFLVAFLCNMQSIRYYAHTSFLVGNPSFKGRKDAIEYVATNLNRGGLFWSLGLRAFYLSFPLFLWVFGPIPMFLCCCVMVFILYYLDTTNEFTRDVYDHSVIDVQDLDHPPASSF